MIKAGQQIHVFHHSKQHGRWEITPEGTFGVMKQDYSFFTEGSLVCVEDLIPETHKIYLFKLPVFFEEGPDLPDSNCSSLIQGISVYAATDGREGDGFAVMGGCKFEAFSVTGGQ